MSERNPTVREGARRDFTDLKHPPSRSGFRHLTMSEISLTCFVAAITIEFDYVAGPFT